MSKVNSYHGSINVSTHAAQRWRQRGSGAASIRKMWLESLDVTAPEVDGDARLYVPENILLVRKGATICTVLHADYKRLDLNGSVRCQTCGNIGSEADECVECGADQRGTGVDRSE